MYTQIELNDFDLRHTFECGQCFRWDRNSDGSYTGIAGEKVVKIEGRNKRFKIYNCAKDDYDTFWRRYLDADRDYALIKKRLADGGTMTEAIHYGSGIRILRQDFFEALVSFIISQRSSIPKIRSCVKKLCEAYGKPIEYDGSIFYSFPSCEKLASINEDEFRKFGVGYRAPYIADAARKTAEGILIASELEQDETAKAREKLLKVRGVGDKVCDCVLLFSLGKYDLFPSDVWIKRVMAEHFGSVDAKNTGENIFGADSGFAQQYLFFWRKELAMPKSEV